MSFEFNAVLDRANCHIRATRNELIANEILKDRPHKHYSMEFHCVFSGQEIINLPLENQQIPLSAGMILLLPQGVYHEVYTKDSTVERICFNFSAEPVGKEPSPIINLFLNISKPVVFDDEETAALAEQCRRLCSQSHGPLLEVRQGMQFLNIALNLMSSVTGVQEDSHATSSVALRQKWAIEDYISQHYTDNSGIEGLAKVLYLSERQTSTLVKRTFGEDFKSIIIRRRMELAQIYLQDPTRRLDEIAYDVGYRSYSGFELCFKRFFGTTPQKMRNKLMNERKENL